MGFSLFVLGFVTCQLIYERLLARVRARQDWYREQWLKTRGY